MVRHSTKQLEPSGLKGLGLPVIRFRQTDEPYIRRRVTHHEFIKSREGVVPRVSTPDPSNVPTVPEHRNHRQA
jgi:hypothetical protein